MVSFENQEMVPPINEKRGKGVGTKKQEAVEQKWRRTIDGARNFLATTLALDGHTGEVVKENLTKGELKRFQQLEGILGENVIKYLGRKELDHAIRTTGSPEEKQETLEQTLVRKEAEQIKEYRRINSLSREELLQEAEKYVAGMRERGEETKKAN